MATKALLGEEEAAMVTRLLTNVPSLGKKAPILRALSRRFRELTEAAQHSKDAATADALEAVMLELDKQEIEIQKLNAVSDANRMEQLIYETRQQQLQAAITQAVQDIETKKQELDEARIGRQHNEEYEVIRALIAEEAQRGQTQQQIDAVQQEIAAIRADAAKAEQTMERRRKQFALLLHCVEDLQRVHDDDQLELADGNQQMQIDAA